MPFRKRIQDPIEPEPLSANEAYLAAARFCAYQERSVLEVRQKLKELGQDPDTTDSLVQRLQEEGYVDDQRFACTFARGKFRSLKWGRNKIRQGLRERGIGTLEAINAMAEVIDDEAYLSAIENLLTKKLGQMSKRIEPRLQRTRLMAFAQSKGFELEVAGPIITRLLRAED